MEFAIIAVFCVILLFVYNFSFLNKIYSNPLVVNYTIFIRVCESILLFSQLHKFILKVSSKNRNKSCYFLQSFRYHVLNEFDFVYLQRQLINFRVKLRRVLKREAGSREQILCG